mgnify:CR=1 FL=1
MEDRMLNIKINNMELTVPYGTTILEAARMAGIEIPTLCFLKDINEIGACRICMVEVKGARSLVAACVYPIERDGTEIFTNTKKVRDSRKRTLELILSTHDKKCLSCVRSGTCELQQLCKEFGVDDENRFEGEMVHYKFDDSAAHMVRDNNKCILCRRCIAACDQQGISVIGANARGFDTHISSAFDKDLADVSCISCGQCIVNCPTGAIVEKDDTGKVLEAINDPEKFVIVNTAPSIRATLGEAFGMHIGTNEKLFGLPFSVYIDAAHAVNGAGWYQATFFYESVYNFIGAILTYCLWRKNKVNGALVFFYAVWYCVIRLILDFLRVDGLLSTKIACVIVIPTFTALGIWYYLHGLKKLDHDKAALEVEEMLASDD